ncbi:MAG: TonB-dependent receptor [Bacteroidetes bacterium]|nr:TonB-dependent receptor [Bacteroidota bacterium]
MQTKTALIILLFFLGVIHHISAGNDGEALLFGIVKHKNDPLPVTAVYVQGTNTGTSTNAEGKFWLYLKPGEYTIVFQTLGFESQRINVKLARNESKEVSVLLNELTLTMDPVTVSGSRIGLLRYLPGSVHKVDGKDQNIRLAVSNADAYRHVPGIHVPDEDPAGLRTNVGIRGLDPDRSRNQLVMEDGVPVALNPYGEPELYYSPAIERMSGVEILKGNGQILFGPQTIGGVINYLTAEPPAQAEGLISLRGAPGGFFTGRLHFGNTHGNTGYTFDYLRKQADQLGPLKFRLNDLNGKIRLKSGMRSVITLKMSVYDEASNATYVGLTQPMFDAGGNDYTVIAPNDRLDIRRYALSLQHMQQLTDQISLRQTAYAYTTVRNWRRQDFTYNSNASGLTGVVWGDPNQPEGAIYMRNSTGNRNRAFEVAGYENRLTAHYELAGLGHQLDAGFRIHTEKAQEQRINGRLAEARSGDLRDDELRRGQAASLFAQQKTRIGQKLSLTYGLRGEAIEYQRTILRVAGKDTLVSGNTQTYALIPGAGVNYNISNELGLFAGIHKGFAPPRIKDAISNSGEDVQLDAELSRNLELGIRYENQRLLANLTAYLMNFSNQVIPVSESSGGQGAGLINGGQTTHKGVEMAMVLKSGKIGQWDVRNGLSGAVMQSQFSDNRYVIQKIRKNAPYDTVWVNVKGNHTPYSPNLVAAAWAEVTHSNGLSAGLSWQFTGRQFTDLLNTGNVQEVIAEAKANPDYKYISATSSGRIGEIPAYQTLNMNLGYEIQKYGLSFHLQARNLLNERYIVTRRPQGIRVGMHRFITAGLEWKF